MSDLWTPTPERERINFSQLELLVDNLTGSNGNAYSKITFNLFPVTGGDLVTDMYFKFSGHTKPWDSDVLPAIRRLVTAGKLKDAPDIDKKYVSWAFRQWRSYRKNDVQYWRDRAETEKQNGQDEEAKKSIGRIQCDERGNEFVEKRYVHIFDVFASEDEALKASDEFYGVENGAAVWGESKEPEPPTGFDDRKTALDFLPNFVKMALGENHKVDLEKLQSFFDDNEVLNKHFTLKSPEVKEAIAALEATPPF